MTVSMTSIASRTEVWGLALASAAFLILYWALRGAPIGQAAVEEGDDAPRASYRDRVIGGVVAGLLLVLTGAYIALSRSIPWSLPLFAAGFGLMLTLIAVNRRHRHTSPALRRTVEFSDAALTVTLLAGILVMINVFAFRYGGQALDFTRDGDYSLSSLTLNQLATLKRPVTFTLFFGDSDRAVKQSDRVQQLLDLYEAANPKLVRLAKVNPYREFEKFEAIAKRVPDVVVTQGGGILIEYGEGEDPAHVVVRNNDLFEIPRGGDFERFESAFHGEDAVTSALIGLREEKKPKVVFTTGHGEPPLANTDPRRPSVGFWKARLGANGSEVIELNTIGEDIPADTALLIVVGPKSPFKPDEVSKLKAYSDHGGPLLILAGNQDKSGLEEFLRTFNIELGPGVAVDRRLNYRGQVSLVYAPIAGKVRHPIVDSLVDRYALVPTAAPIRTLGTGGNAAGNANVLATAILKTSNQSWAETDLSNPRPTLDKGKDEAGPLTVAVAVADRPTTGNGTEGKPRLVFFSSGALPQNLMLEIEPTDQDLLMNAISWLRGRSDLRGIEPKTHVALTLTADPVLRARLILVPTVMAMLLIVGLGITTYVARRE